MADLSAIRRANLKRITEARGLTPTMLATRYTQRVSYWSDLLSGAKSFGEKAARKIEEQLELLPGELDSVEDDLLTRLFADDTERALAALSPDERLRLENGLRAMMGLPTLAASGKRPARAN